MKKALIIAFATLGVLLVVLRLVLPGWAASRANEVLANMESYRGRVQNVEIALLRGEYAVTDLVVEKPGGEAPRPFIAVPRIEFGVDWSEIWRGAVVAEVRVVSPRLTFADGEDAAESQTGLWTDWTKTVERLMPITLNAVEIEDGTVELLSERSGANGESEWVRSLWMEDFDLVARNLSNVRDARQPLHATVVATGAAQGTAQAHFEMKLDPLSDPPELSMDAEVEALPLTELNPLLRTYAGVDAQAGSLEIYLEIASAHGRFEGYVKPLARDVDVLRLDEPGSFFGKAWESLVELAANVLENDESERLGAQVPLSGDLTAVDLELIPAVFSVLRNAFIEALSAGIGDTVSLDSVSRSERAADD